MLEVADRLRDELVRIDFTDPARQIRRGERVSETPSQTIFVPIDEG